jgi:hypothetical protein
LAPISNKSFTTRGSPTAAVSARGVAFPCCIRGAVRSSHLYRMLWTADGNSATYRILCFDVGTTSEQKFHQGYISDHSSQTKRSDTAFLCIARAVYSMCCL